VAKRQPSPEGLGNRSADDPSAVGAALESIRSLKWSSRRRRRRGNAMYRGSAGSNVCLSLGIRYQGTTLVGPYRRSKDLGFSPCAFSLPGKCSRRGTAEPASNWAESL
jgi:hypothetical protein